MTKTILHLTDLEKQFIAMTDIEYWDGDDCEAALDDHKVDYSSRRWKGVASSLCKKGIIFKDEDRGLWIDPEFVCLWGYENCKDYNDKFYAKLEAKKKAKAEEKAKAENEIRWGYYLDGKLGATTPYDPDTMPDGDVNDFIGKFVKNGFTVYGFDKPLNRIDGAALTEDRIITELGDRRMFVVALGK